MIILKTRSEVKVTLDRKSYTTLRHTKMHPHTKFGIPTTNNMKYAPDTFFLNTNQRSSHSDPKMVRDTPPSQDTFTHRIWKSYLKEYLRYAPDSMRILKIRSEVRVKITETERWYGTLHHPNMHPHTKFEIPTSKI